MILLLQKRLNAVKLSGSPVAIDALLNIMIEAGAAYARVEHGARCIARQHANRPWKESRDD